MRSRTLVSTSGRRRLLVDECVPRRFARALVEVGAITVQQAGWTGFKNGKLLARAADSFDVFFTVDRDFAGLGDTVPHAIGVVILQVTSTDFDALIKHVDAVKLQSKRSNQGVSCASVSNTALLPSRASLWKRPCSLRSPAASMIMPRSRTLFR